VVLPYDADVSATADPLARKVAEELPLLLQSAALRAVMKYGSVGSIGLVARPGQTDCTALEVLGKVEPRMQIGQALVLIWGTLFEEDGALEIQTYVRFLRKGSVEGLRFVVGGETFDGEVSDQTVVFSTRRLSPQDLRDIHSAFEDASLLRSAPRADAGGVPMYDLHGNHAFGYIVVGVQGDWLHVDSEFGPSGWVNTGTGFGGKTLAERLPEVDWIDGVAGYLRVCQWAKSGWPPVPNRARTWVHEAFQRFAQHAAGEGSEQSAAVADELTGLMDYAWAEATPEDRTAALAAFERASRKLPWSTAAQSLLEFALLQSGFAADSSAWRPADHEGELLHIVGMDPTNERLLRQLSGFYRLTEANRPSRGTAPADIAPARVREQAARLKEIGLSPSLPAPVAGSYLDLNTAPSDKLRSTLGLDSKQAQAVVRSRPFRGLDDPALEKALGEPGLKRLRNKATVLPRMETVKIER
jgi:DNA uptake protein ComE-like DNA-binding protein